jgi:hypothetical protein
MGGLRIFYSSSILWDSDLSSIRVKRFLLTLTLGSRNYFSRRALILEDHLLRQKIREITFDDFPDTLMRIAFAIYYHRYIPMDIGIHLSFS